MEAVVIFVLAVLVLGVTAAAVSRNQGLVRSAYAEGRRAGLKQAAQIAHERGDVAVYMVPEGELGMGIARGAMAHTLELEILAAMAEHDR